MNRAGLGLRWGGLFASPFIGIAIFVFLIETVVHPSTTPREHRFGLAVIFGLALLSVLIVASGRWWGRNGSRLRWRGVLFASVAQGMLWVFILLVSVTAIRPSVWWINWRLIDWHALFSELARGFAEGSVWSLLLGLTIRWRLSRAYKKRLAQHRQATLGRSA